MAETEIKEKKTPGRKKAFDSPEALAEKVDEYFAECERKEIFPDYAGMRLFIHMKEKTILKYCGKDYPDHEKYAEVFEDAKDRRESWLTRKMVTDNKTAQGCMNALKQPQNGGYTDRPVENTERTLTIKFEKNIDNSDFK